MAFEQLLKKAAEEANENELVILTVDHVRSFLDGDEVGSLENALDHAQGDVHTGDKSEAWVLIKVTK